MHLRIILSLIALVALAPAASADPLNAMPDPDDIVFVVIDPDVEYSPNGCDDCYEASALVAFGIRNCYDCPVFIADAGIEDRGDGAETHVVVCYASYGWFCLIDWINELVAPLINYP